MPIEIDPTTSLPDAAESKRQRGQRGPQKAATKCQVTLRLDQEVIDCYKADGRGWQSRINDTLLDVIRTKKKTAA